MKTIIVNMIKYIHVLLAAMLIAFVFRLNLMSFFGLSLNKSASIVLCTFFGLLVIKYLLTDEIFVRSGTIKRSEHPVMFYMFICILCVVAGIFLASFLDLWRTP